MEASLHGRDLELEGIVAALDGVAGGAGRTLVVEGPAGIGKTALLAVAREEGLARGLAVASARGSDLEMAYAWGIVRQLFEPRLRGMSAAARGRTLSGAAALAGPIVMPDGSRPEVEADASFGVLHGLYWLVAGLAADRPQLLLVDDLHWSDAASIRFLDFLANRIDTVPVLLLAARRPEASGLPGAPLVELGGLSLEATAGVLAEREGKPVPAAFAEACHGATGGNPLLIRRLAEGLRDHDAAAVAEHGPDAIASAVGATLARVGPGPAAFAGAVAVLETAPLVTAARLAGVETDDAQAVAEQLVRTGLLRDARPLAFEHALVRDAVLSGLSAGERAGLHAKAAVVLRDAGAPAEAVAVHLLHAEPVGSEEVAGTLAEVGRRALDSGALDEATACLARALAEPPPQGARAALLLDLARAENGLGRPEALDRVVEAYEVAGDEVERAHAALALMWTSGPGRQDPEEAIAMVQGAIAGVAGRHRELELKLNGVGLMAAFMSSELMQQVLGTAEQYAELEGRTAGECELLAHVALHRYLGGRSAAEVVEPIERAVADPAVVAEIGADSAWFRLVFGALFRADRLDLAQHTLAIVLDQAQRRGSTPGFAVTATWRAWLALRAGDAAAAEADARVAYEVLPAEMWQHADASACLIEVLTERGELDHAQEIAEAALLTTPEERRETLLYARAILRVAQGDPAGALEDQLEARRLRGDIHPDPDFDGWLRIARLRHVTGDAPGALAEAESALEWARVWGTHAYVGQALTVMGLLLGGDEGLASLREGVEELERSQARIELARSLVELGAALRRAGERAAAREPLRTALEIATEGGLVATAERAAEELRVTGARVRRLEASGIDSLTPSERRIAAMAAGGASNPEIAQALFVTVKTVEMHLGNTYRKLDVRSRRELEPLFESTGSSP